MTPLTDAAEPLATAVRRGRPKGPDKIPTTIRLPNDVHHRLRIVAATLGKTLEKVVLEALTHEFERLTGVVTRHVEVPETMDALLAETFLQSLPSFCVIKKQDRIVWPNLFFLDRLGRTFEDVRGRTLVDAGLVEGELAIDTVRYNIAEALKRDSPQMRIETLKLKNLGHTNVRTLRFKFDRLRYLGDLSFIETDIRERTTEDISAVSRMRQLPAPAPDLQKLFLPLLETAPLAMALKRWQGDQHGSTIEWANRVFIELVHRNQRVRRVRETAVVGELTKSALGIPLDHSVLLHEAQVVRTGRGNVAKNELPGLDPRWSFRFPIVDSAGAVKFVGVVSPDFRLQSGQPRTASHPPRRSTGRWRP